ncbi:MAG TPA: efflux RND transporter permease subunit, partial [Paracoccaceae bacterium]|nr:efflux RND transporter permease subunit [Paracoccaceae bacterium]
RTGTILVRLDRAELSADFLARTRLRTAEGAYVPLADVVSVTPVQGFSTVRRHNGQRIVTVSGDLDQGDPDAVLAFRAALGGTLLPELAERWGVAWEQGGLVEQEREFLSDATIGFIACLVGIFGCLAWVLASWSRPFVIMAIIPFGFVGAAWGHLAWNMPLSMFSIVGLIGMTGIIINDSIVLVHTIDSSAARRALGPAIVDAAVERLRPVLLTTLTTVLGMAPLLFEPSVQAQFLKPTVITLCYGLGFGVLLVLVVVPALVGIQEDIRRFVHSLRRAFGRRSRLSPGLRLRLQLTGLAALGLVAGTAGIHAITGAVPPGLGGLAAALLPGLSPWAATLAGLLFGLAALGVLAAPALLAARERFSPGAPGSP